MIPSSFSLCFRLSKRNFFSCKSIKFLLFILIEQNLPGVDPDSEAVRAAMGAMKVSLVRFLNCIVYYQSTTKVEFGDPD